jgi:hypothetical protein
LRFAAPLGLVPTIKIGASLDLTSAPASGFARDAGAS